MKNWPADHPKAKLMDRKREAILAAARRQFLANGYGGTSMESIAAEAGVSIMTLYRHAQGKDELFEAVISIACDDHDGVDAAAIAAMPLREVLMGSALAFQSKLLSEETIALLRAVIAEHGRFPDLATATYRGAIGHLEELVFSLLGRAVESRELDQPSRRRLASSFADDLFGADIVGILLGLNGRSATDQQERAKRATAELLAAIPLPA